MQCFLNSLHPREIRCQSSSTRCSSVKLLFLVTAPRGKPERPMKEMEHRSGTFFSGISLYMHRGSASRTVEQRRIADRGAAEAAAQQQQHSSSSTAAAGQQQQHSSSDGGDVELLFLVPPPRGKPERQMKKMEPKRDILSGLSAYYALRISIANSRSSSTAAVVAATSRLRTKRTSVDTPVSLLFSFLRFRAI